MAGRERGGGGDLVEAVLLAAGESTRMGELKALLTWDGRPLVRYAVDQLLASPVERVAVVLGHGAPALRALLPPDGRLLVVENPDFRSGKVSSILAGLAALDRLPDSGARRHVLVLGVDQPRPAGLLAGVVAAHLAGGAAITVAAHGGRRGHPVVFGPAVRPDLRAIEERTEGLRAVLQRHAGEVRLHETESPLTLVNLNTPEDYAAALVGQPRPH